nr:rna polymerase ii-associated protein rba50 [Quercus suber]
MIPGQRVEIDLGSDDEDQPSQQPVMLPGAFVGDVLERSSQAPRAPSAPTLKSNNGFPEHKKRNIENRFKRQKAVNPSRQQFSQTESPHTVHNVADSQPVATSPAGRGEPKTWEQGERQRIDEENRQKLAAMSPAEIEEERQELMDSLSPAFLQHLLRRSNINSGSAEAELDAQPPQSPQLPASDTQKSKPKDVKSVSFADPPPSAAVAEPADEDRDKPTPTEPPQSAMNPELPPHDSIHFPQPQQPPDLDPASATFFEDLHTKYFPALPSEPEKLAWMQASKAKHDSSYDPSATAFKPQDIRFSFTGELIPPKTAAEIPVTMGLHHHGDSPDAAGYTIPELAHLARSAYAAQRCIAFQTLGRILFRLGKGEFGDSGEPGAEWEGAQETFGELARGLWGVVEGEKVIETLVRESEGTGVDRGRHLSAKAYATEAVWLWRKGGGRRWKAA